MKQLRPLAEVVREVAHLTSTLSKGVREETIGVMLGLGYNYLDSALLDQLLKEPTVANALEQLVLDSLTRGRVEGQREAILTVLSGRFGAVPAALRQQVSGTSDHTRLQRLVVEAATAPTLEEFAQALSGANGG